MSTAASASARRPAGALPRLDALTQAYPEWAAWLRVLRELIPELSDRGWDERPPRTSDTSPVAPLLAAAELRPDGRAVAQLLDRLIGVARAQGMQALVGSGSSAQAMSVDDALAVFLAVLNEDDAALDEHAARMGASPEGWRTLARLLPMPYLHACARRWAAEPAPWAQGYCPVCGAWPAIAELRGIERSRHLRCGRCGTGWPMPILACTYCANTDHDTLASLVSEGKTSNAAVDVCHGCSGYLKACNALQATPCDEILLADLASVEFDLAAVERGFLRPAGAAVALVATIAGQPAPASASGGP